jgi:hypothetical protein
MKKTVLAISLLLMVSGGSVAFAEETGAGCGIGKVLMEGKTGTSNNVVAAILNTILIPNTFFMTTGILGCDTTQTVQKEEVREVFVASNMDNLSQDIAQGQGDYLTALATVMGVDKKDEQAFYTLTQEQYGELFSSTQVNARQMLATLDNALLSDPALAKYVK